MPLIRPTTPTMDKKMTLTIRLSLTAIITAMFLSILSPLTPTRAQAELTTDYPIYLPLVITNPTSSQYELLNNYSIILTEDSYWADIYGEVANHTSTDKYIQVTIRGYDALGDLIDTGSTEVFTPANDRTCFHTYLEAPQPYAFDHFAWDPLVGTPIDYQWEFSLDSVLTVIESQIITTSIWDDNKYIYISGKVRNTDLIPYYGIRSKFTIYSNIGSVLYCNWDSSWIDQIEPLQTLVFSSWSFSINSIFEPFTYRMQWSGEK